MNCLQQRFAIQSCGMGIWFPPNIISRQDVCTTRNFGVFFYLEVVELSKDNDKWKYLVRIFASWRKNLELNSNVNDEDVKELIMSLSPAYLKQCEEWKQEGKEEGRQEGQKDGQRLMIESLLAVRFGNLDEDLSAIVSQLMELSLTERTQLLINLSREELLARFKVD
jgi:hypothetical protein